MATVISFERLSPAAIPPKRENPSDAGWDLFLQHDTAIPPGSPVMVAVGWRLHMPLNECLYVHNLGTSGISVKGIIILPGVIDPGYEGDIGPIVLNATQGYINLKRGDKISQLVFLHTANVENRPDFRVKPIRKDKFNV